LQADTIITPSGASSAVTQETTHFIDEMEGVSVGMSTAPADYLMDDSVTSADLAGFLARPVRIASFTWNETDVPGILQSINPWYLFFNDTRIKYKLNNYSFIRADLKVKVIINASPFYYGAMLMAYQPLPNFTPTTIVNDTGTRYFIPYSQRPHMWISPQHSEGGEMTLPFFYQKNWLRVQVAQDFTDMGRLDFIDYTALNSANGATGQGVTVQVYAWAENVVLSGPSLGLSLQCDEYVSAGPISGPASTVARYASLLKGVPIIGTFATATEMGANAVSGIAKLFGFTNVPELSPAHSVRPSPLPRLASPEIGFPVETLTLDCKNELSIDPRILGLSGEDELAIESIVRRQSYLCSTTWSTTTLVDTPLFTSRVTPFMMDNDGGTYNKMYFTPMGYVCPLFKHWRGDIIFTFKFVASPFHKGRVRISYDPYSTTIQTVGDTGSGTFNTIVDLGAETEVEVRVPYQQALAWLKTSGSFAPTNVPFSTSASPALTLDDTAHNGMISMKVLTLLTAPVSTAPVTIMVFVKAADNLEFANPQPSTTTSTLWTIQSSEEIIGVKAEIGGSSTLKMDRYRVNFGETIRSLRPLLRRANYTETFCQPTAGTGNGFIYNRHTRFPLYYGYDPNGIHSAKGLITPATTYPFNWTRPLAYHWIAPAFIAQRGSAMWHYNVESSTPCSHVWATRIPLADYTSALVSNVSSTTATNSLQAAFYKQQFYPSDGGTAVTNQMTNGCLSVSVPSANQYKFQTTRPGATSNPLQTANQQDGGDGEFVAFGASFNTADGPHRENIRVHKFFGVGVDFNLHFFLNAPVVTRITSDPTPA